MNLLMTEWLPIRRRSGARSIIAPAQLTERDDPPVALDSPRADFNQTLTQFLIGLLQSCAPASDELQWRKRLASPPLVEALEAAFGPFVSAFELFGDGPRFMQDLEPFEASSSAIMEMMIDIPAGNTLVKNADIFKRRAKEGEGISPNMAAMGLLTIQMLAPAGGQGHRAALRGGSFLTTLIQGKTLWETVWLNTIPGQPAPDLSVFPWMAPTITSEDGQTVEPQDAHELTAFWACPLRIRLGEPGARGECALSGGAGSLVYTFTKLNYGASYKNWCHQLTPYNETGPLNARELDLQPRSELLGEGAAWAVSHLKRQGPKGRYTLHCSGWLTDKAKIMGWVEHEQPLYVVSDQSWHDQWLSRLDQLRFAVAEVLLEALKRALYGSHSLTKTGKASWAFLERPSSSSTLFDSARRELMRATELDWAQLQATLAQDHGQARELAFDWAHLLSREALRVFELYAGPRELKPILPSTESPSRVLAQQELWAFTQPHAKAIKKLLDV